MKIDPHKQKERYFKWKEKVKDGIRGISKENSDIILKYVFEMEKGINVSAVSAKGGRSFIRLNTLRERMTFLAKKFKEIYNLDKITNISEED
jgi:hypothetical protein